MTRTTTGNAPIRGYLTRIGIDGVPQPTPDALRQLQRAHLTHVPLDTIDAYLTQHDDLNPRSVTDRIIHEGRGGSGSQLNVGFGVLLHGLGYLVDLVLAHVAEPISDSDDVHVALIVATAGRRFLVDVSGALSDAPLALDTVASQADTAGIFAVSTTTSAELEILAPGNRRFTIDSVRPDGTGPDQWRQISGTGHPRGISTSRLAPFLSVRRERGRTTLFDGRLVETVGAAQTVITLDPTAVSRVVRDRFGIILTQAALTALQRRGQ